MVLEVKQITNRDTQSDRNPVLNSYAIGKPTLLYVLYGAFAQSVQYSLIIGISRATRYPGYISSGK